MVRDTSLDAGATVGSAIGPYQFVRALGAGGMGQVFLARDNRLGRDVAIKMLSPNLARTSHFGKQLLREGRAIARLNHLNIAQIYDVVEDNDRTLIVMEYLDGESLNDRIKRGPVPPLEVATLGAQIAAGLEHAHRQGILHCDIKPANVFVTRDGVVKILDFGLAQSTNAEGGGGDPGLGATPTMLALRAGTPAYMSPEQKSGSKVTAHSDIFGVGMVLYELASGRRADIAEPVADETAPTETALAVDVHHSIPLPLRRVITKALAWSPDRRFDSAASLRRALESAKETLSGASSFKVVRFAVVGAILVAAAVGAFLATRGPASWGSSPPVVGGLPIVAVLPFTSSDTTTDSRFLAAGLTELMTDRLSASTELVVMSSATVRAAAQVEDAVEVDAVARKLGATFLVTGRFESAGAKARVALRVFKTGRAEPLVQVFETTLSDVLTDSPALAATVRSLMQKAGLPVKIPASEGAARPIGRAALEDYAAGLDLLGNVSDPQNLDRAIDRLSRSVERDPNFALAHAALGEALWRKYRRTREQEWAMRAQTAALDAVRLGGDEPRVRYTVALVLRGTGKSAQAIDELRKALTLQPNYTEAHRLLGTLLAETGNLPGALVAFGAARELQPNSPDTHHEIGLAYYDAGKFQDAIDALQKETEIRPTASAFQVIGACYQSLGRDAEALQSYAEANRISPSPMASSNIGMIYFSRKQFTEAVAAYRESASLAPKVPETRRNLGDSLDRVGDAAAASRSYRQAIALADDELRVNPTDAKLIVLKAVCYAKLQKVAEARAARDRALSLAQADSEVQYLSGVASALVGDSVRALALLQRALDLGYSRAVLDADDDLKRLRGSAGYESLRPSRR